MQSKINLARWQPHLAAAQRRGQTVAAYAAEHGLSRHTLYAAAKTLRESAKASDGQVRRRKKPVPAFAAVRVSALQPPPPEVSRLRAQLPNGVVVHLEGASSPPQLATWLTALGALACSV